jgi:hypothetical protein
VDSDPTIFFTGEMVFPWMPQDYGTKVIVSLSAVAEALATARLGTLMQTICEGTPSGVKGGSC